MSGTKIGAAKAVQTILAKDPEFYKKAGRVGGAASGTGGFYHNPERARVAGRKGGHNGRGKTKDRSKQKVIIIPPKPTIMSKVRGVFHV